MDYISRMRDFPEYIERVHRSVVNEDLLETKVNDWTPPQIINHIADSMMNSVIRIKFALTMDNPAISGYNQNKWAELFDTKNNNVENALLIIRGLYLRTAELLENTDSTDMKRTFKHSEIGVISIERYILDVVNHGYYHIKAVENLLDYPV